MSLPSKKHRVLDYLHEHGEGRRREISEALDITLPATSGALRELGERGFAKVTREEARGLNNRAVKVWIPLRPTSELTTRADSARKKNAAAVVKRAKQASRRSNGTKALRRIMADGRRRQELKRRDFAARRRDLDRDQLLADVEAFLLRGGEIEEHATAESVPGTPPARANGGHF